MGIGGPASIMLVLAVAKAARAGAVSRRLMASPGPALANARRYQKVTPISGPQRITLEWIAAKAVALLLEHAALRRRRALHGHQNANVPSIANYDHALSFDRLAR